jgi:hypothetical protein
VAELSKHERAMLKEYSLTKIAEVLFIRFPMDSHHKRLLE